MLFRAGLCAAVASIGMACFAQEKATPEAKERIAIELALANYEEEVARAKGSYDETLLRAGKKLLATYDVVIAAAMRRGGGEALDLANRLNDEKKLKASLFESGEVNKKTNAKKAGAVPKKKGSATETAQPFVGVWQIKYCPNKTIRTYVILPSGDVEYEGARSQLKPMGESTLLEVGGKLERLTFKGGRVFVEHFSAKSGFANNEPDQVGVGELMKGN